jgi:protein-S-isoprenylcysteine O-methyltransferase Ste14
VDRESCSSQDVNEGVTAGVIARPPLLFLSALLLGHAADHVLPRPFSVPEGGPAHGIIGASLIVMGLGLATAGIRNLSRAGTPVQTNRPVRVLVTSGIHGWTRNPIYLGMFLLYGGIGLAIRGPWLLLFLVPLTLAIRYGVVAREEAYLERLFGGAYRSYKGRVRRWL